MTGYMIDFLYMISGVARVVRGHDPVGTTKKIPYKEAQKIF